MASSRSPDFFAILECLAHHEVEFVLVGGLCAVVHGAPVVTMDVDIVHHRSEENVERLLAALGELESVYRHHPKRIEPRRDHLSGPGHQLLRTKSGDLDVLGEIDQGRGYDELLAHVVEVELGDWCYRMLSLEELIRIKERAGREKDRAVLPMLRHTLARIQSGDPEESGRK